MNVSPIQSAVSNPAAVSVPTGALELDPFENTRDCRFYFGSAAHEQAVQGLMSFFDDGNQGFALLSGASGLGKTLVRTMLHRRLDPGRFVRVSIETSLLDFDGLLLEIISQMQGERIQAGELPDRYSRLGRFKQLLSDRVVHPGRHLAILVDEAHGLDRPALDGLRNLSNVNAEQRNLMSVALIGGNSLDGLFGGLTELAQRVSFAGRLRPLDTAETRAYVDHRLRVAGSPSGLAMDDETQSALHTVSGGVPAEINRLLKGALQKAREAARPLDQQALANVLQDRRQSLSAAPGESTEFLGV